MSDAIITVKGLGKKYRISHQGDRQRYVALRDVIAQKLKKPFQFLRKSKIADGSLKPSSISHLPSPGAAVSPISHLPSPGASSEDFWALRDVSFEVKRGEVVGIIGRNGAGKSTLLKILSRITEPTTGRVRLRGRVASLLEVGTGFHPELTGRENVFLNGAILGMSRAEIRKKFDEIVAFAEVEKFLDTPVKRYSSGMYVRLAFAVAAHLEPEILIVDEVLAVGDAEFQKKCLGKMKDVASGGRTVLFVSHNMAAVSSLCSRGIVIKNGFITLDGPAHNCIEFYLTPNSGDMQHSLAHRKDRTGSGRFQFTGVRFLIGGSDVMTAQTGSDFEIELLFEAAEAFRAENLRFGISLVTMTGVEFLSFDSAATAQVNSCFVPQSGKVRLRIPSLPVKTGNYRGWLYAAINGVVADRVEDAFEIEVLGGQYPKMGFFDVRHEWTVEPNQNDIQTR
jgi:lipopolysaccharide transport system ATP-binding protein